MGAIEMNRLVAAASVLSVAAGCSDTKLTRPADEHPPSSSVQQHAVAPRSSDGVRQRLFEGDRRIDALPLSISIETLGGVSTVLLPRGASLPVEKTEVFSTAADNQTSVEIHVVQGEQRFARDNRSLGKFHLAGISAMPRGQPKIEVAFRVDADGVLEVSAKDLAAGTSQQITVTGAPARPLSYVDVDEMVRNVVERAATNDSK